MEDKLSWSVALQIKKWDDEKDYEAGLEPNAIEDFERNLLLNAGITRLLNLLAGAGGQAFDTTHARIGVGNGNTASLATMADLTGASKFFKLCSSVSVVAQTVTFNAVFAAADGNFAWEEWGIDNGTADSAVTTAPLLNRKVQVMGTKASPAVWTVAAAITVA